MNPITAFIAHTGYAGVFVWMLLESACIPVPSEVVMPFAGGLVATSHTLNLTMLAVVGALGNLVGSILAYWLGACKGRKFFERYGKYVLMTKQDIDTADEWFRKRGTAAVFFGRVLPMIRTFISLPAGISGMAFGKFCAYSFAGSLIWSYLLAWLGFKLGQHWDTIGVYFHGADIVVGIVLIVAAYLWIRRRKKAAKSAEATPAPA